MVKEDLPTGQTLVNGWLCTLCRKRDDLRFKYIETAG